MSKELLREELQYCEKITQMNPERVVGLALNLAATCKYDPQLGESWFQRAECILHDMEQVIREQEEE